MVNGIKEAFSHHKEGFKILKIIHSIDSSAIPVSILYSLLNAIYPYINLFFSAYIIDNLIIKEWNKVFIYVGFLITIDFLLGLAKDGLKQCEDFKSTKIQQYTLMKIREKALSLDYETLENAKTLEMINTADDSINRRGGIGLFLKNYRRILESIFSIIASISIVFYLCFQVGKEVNGIAEFITSKYISLTVILGVLASILYFNYKNAKLLNDKTLETFDKQKKCERRLVYYVFQVIQDYTKAKDVRIYNMQSMISEENIKGRQSIKDFYWNWLKFEVNNKINISLFSGTVNIVIYVFVIFKAIVKAISIGDITKYIGALAQLNNGLTKVVQWNDEIRVQCSYLKYYNNFFNLKNNHYTGTIPIEKRNDNEYEIEFHNVSFAYPGSCDYVLKNISLKIKLKEKLAVVGKNGTGKTTFIKLLCRLYEPTNGYITLNNIDIRKYDYEEYMSLFGVVFQDFNLFAFPIEQNVSSSIYPDEDKVWQCLELSGIKEEVENMEDKLKTYLYKYEEKGIEISGGEAQKIAIARALYKDAPFVILDEPTAALDPLSEYEIYSRFNDMVKNKTSIFISHRMSSCRFCNNIIVFDKGNIIQRGNHEELMKDKEEVYYKLFNAQAQYYKDVV